MGRRVRGITMEASYPSNRLYISVTHHCDKIRWFVSAFCMEWMFLIDASKYKSCLQIYPLRNTSSVGSFTCGPLGALSLTTAVLSSSSEASSMPSASSSYVSYTCSVRSVLGRPSLTSALALPTLAPDACGLVPAVVLFRILGPVGAGLRTIGRRLPATRVGSACVA
jgi:hypothetical protein